MQATPNTPEISPRPSYEEKLRELLADDEKARLALQADRLAKLTGHVSPLKGRPSVEPLPPKIDGAALPEPDVGLEPPAPEPVTRFASMTWRMMEEARMNALEEVKDIDAQIAALQMRRRDAMKAANMCEIGQKVD